MLNIQEIMNRVEKSEFLSYDVLNSVNTIVIVIEDFEGFEDNWNEIVVDVNEEEVVWAKKLDGLTIDGWYIRTEWASEEI